MTKHKQLWKTTLNFTSYNIRITIDLSLFFHAIKTISHILVCSDLNTEGLTTALHPVHSG